MNKRQAIAEKVLATFLSGGKVHRKDINDLGEDANYVIDHLRNKKLVPIECSKGGYGRDSFWYMSKDNIVQYQTKRSDQIAKQKHAVFLEQRKRQLKSTAVLLKSLDLPISEELKNVMKSTFTNTRGTYE
ncbi:hypothetical protein [Rosenbergiella epipactidis]|uniref:hypothetical protein n=1 Tax=Rosenbergiella epipactidis TaxID=1544694 RepID=UPI001F4EC1C7|nr:hypothetical protein [Rosenbergiella epipactidis]